MTAKWLRVQLWVLVLLLCAIGMVMIASTTSGMNGSSTTGLNYGFLVKQGLALLVGLAAAVVISWMGSERLGRGWVVALAAVVTVGSLVAVHVIGKESHGAKRWIDLGPINLQPAELAKFALVIVAAWHLTRCAERVRVLWNGVLLPLLAFALVGGLIYLTKDLGSVVVMAVVLGGMFVFSGASWLYYVSLGILLLPPALYVTVYQVSYRRDRMLAFWDPWNSEGPAAYHLRQSLITIGSGGMTGVGLGQSSAKLAFLPEKHTDFIFAVICEELGLIGASAVAFLFLALVLTGIFVAAQARGRHQRLLAVGATMVLGFQGFWNMLVVVGAVPTKGLTLPFISYGGSSLVVCLCLIGVLDAVARSTVKATRRTSSARIGAAVLGSQSWRWQSEGGR